MARSEKKLLQPGKGNFLLVGAYDTNRDGDPLTAKKSGAPMFKLVFNITDCNGNDSPCDEYIVPASLWKYKSLLEATNRLDLLKPWHDIKVMSLLGLSGKCILQNETFNDIASTRIEKFLKPTAAEKKTTIVDVSHMIEDDSDLPF